MSLFKAFKVSGSALSAQSQRLNAITSNMANATTVAGNKNEVYQARKVVFEAKLERAATGNAALAEEVRVKKVVQTDAEPKSIYSPEHPLADENGYIYQSNVNLMEEIVDMKASEASYRANAEMMTTTKMMMLKALNIGNNQ